MSAVGIHFFLLLLTPPAFGEAIVCKDECTKLAQPTRRAELQCEIACERKHPESLSYCPEFSPCLLGCEEKLPEESLLPGQREEKTKCLGPCFTQYLKLDCNPYRPPGGKGAGGAGTQSKAEAGGGAVTMASAVKSDAKKEILKEKSSSAPLSRASSEKKEQSEVLDAASSMAGLNFRRKALEADPSTTKGEGALAVLVQGALHAEAEPTIFELVSRKYRILELRLH